MSDASKQLPKRRVAAPTRPFQVRKTKHGANPTNLYVFFVLFGIPALQGSLFETLSGRRKVLFYKHVSSLVCTRALFSEELVALFSE